MLDKTEVIKIAKSYAEEVKKVLKPTAILLFGSYVNGNANELSDIDIAVLVNDFQGNWLETTSILLGVSWKISLDIEPHLLDEIHDQSGFVKHVIKTGEFIYKA